MAFGDNFGLWREEKAAYELPAQIDTQAVVLSFWGGLLFFFASGWDEFRNIQGRGMQLPVHMYHGIVKSIEYVKGVSASQCIV